MEIHYSPLTTIPVPKKEVAAQCEPMAVHTGPDNKSGIMVHLYYFLLTIVQLLNYGKHLILQNDLTEIPIFTENRYSTDI